MYFFHFFFFFFWLHGKIILLIIQFTLLCGIKSSLVLSFFMLNILIHSKIQHIEKKKINKSIQGESSKTLKRRAQSSRCLAQSGSCVNPLLHHMPLGRDKVGGFDLQAFHSASDSNHLIKAPFVQIRLMLQKKKRKNESLFKVGSNFFKVFWYFQPKKKGFEILLISPQKNKRSLLCCSKAVWFLFLCGRWVNK